MKLLPQFVLIFCIVASATADAAEAIRVSAPGDPVAEQFRLRFPKKDHLTARQLYDLGYPSSAHDKAIGQFVLLDVVVTNERQVPLVEVVIPKELAAGPKPWGTGIQTHLTSVTTEASSLKKGERLRIEGIIVDECYGAYTIYLQEARLIQ